MSLPDAEGYLCALAEARALIEKTWESRTQAAEGLAWSQPTLNRLLNVESQDELTDAVRRNIRLLLNDVYLVTGRRLGWLMEGPRGPETKTPAPALEAGIAPELLKTFGGSTQPPPVPVPTEPVTEAVFLCIEVKALGEEALTLDFLIRGRRERILMPLEFGGRAGQAPDPAKEPEG